jgi:hypothetical protein
MTVSANYPTYHSSPQRMAHIYVAALTPFLPVIPPETAPEQQAALAASERDLHAFLQSLYAALYQSPQQFGLPLSPDMYIVGDEPNPKQFKQAVKQHLDKPKALIEQGMDFLLFLGARGSLNGSALLFTTEEYEAILRESKVKKPFLGGLAGLGLVIFKQAAAVAVSCANQPDMLPALRLLAQACAQYQDVRLGKFNFARADFRALDGQFAPSALDLYPIFEPADCDRLTRLHHFMAEHDYHPEIQYYGMSGFEVQYQGPKKIKASPLLRVMYSYRHLDPLQVDIKCVSVNRAIPLVLKQPRFLQEDFSRRLNNCNGDKCNWCQDKKGLGPSVFEFDGVKRTVCWYHNPDIAVFDEDALRLVQQYTCMHDELLPVV